MSVIKNDALNKYHYIEYQMNFVRCKQDVIKKKKIYTEK